jgi:hypothetical protein
MKVLRKKFILFKTANSHETLKKAEYLLRNLNIKTPLSVPCKYHPKKSFKYGKHRKHLKILLADFDLISATQSEFYGDAPIRFYY